MFLENADRLRCDSASFFRFTSLHHDLMPQAIADKNSRMITSRLRFHQQTWVFLDEAVEGWNWTWLKHFSVSLDLSDIFTFYPTAVFSSTFLSFDWISIIQLIMFQGTPARLHFLFEIKQKISTMPEVSKNILSRNRHSCKFILKVLPLLYNIKSSKYRIQRYCLMVLEVGLCL